MAFNSQLPARPKSEFFHVKPKHKKPGAQQAGDKDIVLKQQPGYTGTAHALLQGGVPTVVAMRYSVGDDYARELAQEFYRALLAHAQPKNTTVALTQARHALLDKAKHEQSRFAACDHATPLLYGAEQPGLALAQGRSPALNPRDPRLHRINELSMMGHEHFVGRTWELVWLGADFIGSKQGAEVKHVALITGLGGMGKTALTAEALALWESRFEWVLLYQAKPDALSFDATLRDIHIKLNAELGRYHEHVKARPADAIHREASAEFTGPERLQRLTRNLLRALKDEAILLVLDNFESNLKQHSAAMNTDGHCQDPAWDQCLSALASELAGSPSRVLITCRRPIAVLEGVVHHVLLGPLPASEAALYLREHRVLGRMVFGFDAGEKTLAFRLLNASRFHPLLMDRLARLAAQDGLRPQLLQALDKLENTKDFAQLPALFASMPGDARELAYLDDALAASLDQLIRDASPDARRLLWVIATANEPIPLSLLKSMWSEETREQQMLRLIQRDLGRMHELTPEQQEPLSKLPPEIHAKLNALPPKPQSHPAIKPLLLRLVGVGLVTEVRMRPEEEGSELSCHELVRERIQTWMEQHAQDRGELTQSTIRLGYAERLLEIFESLQNEDMGITLQAGSRALVYCVQAEAWDHMDGFVGQLVTTIQNPRLLEELIPHLRSAANLAPEGAPRYRCLLFLADALDMARHHYDSFPLYEQAAIQAHVAASTDSENSKSAWKYLAIISQNWADALTNVSEFDAAYQRYSEAIDAYKTVGDAAIEIISCELDILRIAIKQGKADTALSDVEERLAQFEDWWQLHRTGQLPEAIRINTSLLARKLIRALEISGEAHLSQENWDAVVQRLDSILEMHSNLGSSGDHGAFYRMSRANVLVRLNRFSEAQVELEDCFRIFHENPTGQAKVLNALADLFDEQDDVTQAITQSRRALAICENLPSPSDRALSHNNLANYLQRAEISATGDEANRHRLAALIYLLVAELGQQLKTTLKCYVKSFHNAFASGVELTVPRVNELLDDSAFDSLQQWLLQRLVDIDELQTKVDSYLDLIRQAVIEQG